MCRLNACTSTSKATLVLLLLLLIPLAGLVAWVLKHYNASPFYPGYHFPRDASLAVWPDIGMWDLADTRAMCLDLTEGRLSSVKAGYHFLSLRDSRGIGYELGQAAEQGYTVLTRDGVSDSTKVICNLPSYADFRAVHADRYLLGLQTDQVVALDVKAVTSGEGSMITLATSGLNPALDRPCVVSGQSIFLLPCSNAVPLCVRACTIEAGQMKELVNWPVGGTQALAVVDGNRIISLAPNGKSLEVRRFDERSTAQQLVVDQVILQQWCMSQANLSTLTFTDPKTTQFQTVRLSDFSRIEALDGLSPVHWNQFRSDRQSAEPLTLFMRGTVDDLIVFDAVQGKVAAEFKLDEAVSDAHIINDHQIAAVSNRWGGTIIVMDVPSQRIVAKYFPMFWPLVGAVVLSLATIGWCLFWLRNSTRGRLPLAVDWIVLACVLVLPALYRMLSYETWSMHWRYSVTIVQAGVVTALFAVSCYLFYGSARWPYRLIAWLAVFGGVSLGMMLAHSYSPAVFHVFPGQAWMHFAMVAGLSFVVAKLFSPLIRRAYGFQYEYSRGPKDIASQNKRVQMIDWFALTTALAMLLAAGAASQPEFDKLMQSIGHVVAGPTRDLVAIGTLSAQVVVTQFVAACLFLTRSAVANRMGWMLGGIACIVLVVDALMTLLAANIYLQFFSVLLLARVVALIYLLTAAWLWRMLMISARQTPCRKSPVDMENPFVA